jgi:hypothetical protein
MIVTLLVAAATVPAPTSVTGGPYASSLLDLTATPALAASCGNRACDLTAFRTCYNNPGTRCKLNVRTAAGCATIPC